MSDSDFETFDPGLFSEDIESQQTSEPQETPVSLQYGTHVLSGKLYLVTPADFRLLFWRFYGILPEYSPRLEDTACKPWVLLRSTPGLTWIHIGGLPADVSTQDALDWLDDKQDLSFAALTDNVQLFTNAQDHFHLSTGALALGQCDSGGNFVPSPPSADHANKLIIALPSTKPFPGTRSLEYSYQAYRDGPFRTATKQVVDYPPLAVAPSLIKIIDEINEISAKPSDRRHAEVYGRPTKRWLNWFLGNPTKRDSSSYLSQNHALYPHRGNEAVFDRDVWHAVCFPTTLSEDEAVAQRPKGHGGEKMHDAYFQKLFEDLQVHWPQRVEETDNLKGAGAKRDSLAPGDDQNVVVKNSNWFYLHGDGELVNLFNDAHLQSER